MAMKGRGVERNRTEGNAQRFFNLHFNETRLKHIRHFRQTFSYFELRLLYLNYT